MCTVAVGAGDSIRLGSTVFHVEDTPCHTSGHVMYHTDGAAFTGDTLFCGGVGKFFEGQADDMRRTLYDVICTLPESTLIFCGHEYTVENLEFATMVEPENKAVRDKLRWAISLLDTTSLLNSLLVKCVHGLAALLMVKWVREEWFTQAIS